MLILQILDEVHDIFIVVCIETVYLSGEMIEILEIDLIATILLVLNSFPDRIRINLTVKFRLTDIASDFVVCTTIDDDNWLIVCSQSKLCLHDVDSLDNEMLNWSIYERYVVAICFTKRYQSLKISVFFSYGKYLTAECCTICRKSHSIFCCILFK